MFDTQKLIEDLKAAGLPMIEADVKVLTKTIFAWAKQSCIEGASKQPLLAIAVPVLEQLESIALATEDKIDGVKSV